MGRDVADSEQGVETRLQRHGISQARKTGAGHHFLLQGNLPKPGIKPTSLASPVSPGRFFIPLAPPGKPGARACMRLLELKVGQWAPRGLVGTAPRDDIRGSSWLGPARHRGGSIRTCLSKAWYHIPMGLPKEIPSPREVTFPRSPPASSTISSPRRASFLDPVARGGIVGSE